MKVGTICARNYLTSARLLGASLKEVHPEWELTILLVDITVEEKYLYEEATPEFAWLTPDELNIEPTQLARMKFFYDVTEFSTSLKPWLMEQLLVDSDVAMYLDPDIEVFNPIERFEQLAQEHEIVLLPHVTKPVPRDGLDPKEETFLLSGQFNLGFICLSRAAGPFLEYWKERLVSHSIIDHEHGYFTDQRWVDAVPSLFRNIVVRTPGYNVAYWNLHENDVSYSHGGHTDGEVLVGNEPLRFFHFSGHNPSNSLVLSKFAPNPRVRIHESVVVRDVLERRAARMGNVPQQLVPYQWDRMPDGRKIAKRARRGYLTLVHEEATRLPSPFFKGSEAEFYAWLEDESRSGICNLALLFWRGSRSEDQSAEGSQPRVDPAFLSGLCYDAEYLKMATPKILKSTFSAGSSDTRIRPGFNLMLHDDERGEAIQWIEDAVLEAGIPLKLCPEPSGQHLPAPFDQPFSINLWPIESAEDVAAMNQSLTTHRSNVAVLAHPIRLTSEDFRVLGSSCREIWCHRDDLDSLHRFNNKMKSVQVLPDGQEDHLGEAELIAGERGRNLGTRGRWVGKRFDAMMVEKRWKR